MSDCYDLKKLCLLSRLEIDESKIQQTAEKIEEIISFFNKLDEFEISEPNEKLNNSDSNSNLNLLKLEKKLNNLRNDVPNKNSDSSLDSKTNLLFNFKFHSKKDGYVIGPKI